MSNKFEAAIQGNSVAVRYCPAREVGVFDSVEAALAHVGLQTQTRALEIQNAATDRRSFGWWLLNENHDVLVTEEDGIFVLWKGFHRLAGSSRSEALANLEAFALRGVGGLLGYL